MKFKLQDIYFYNKDGVIKCRIIVYCSYGFIIDFFKDEKSGRKLLEMSKSPNFDITNLILVSYDRKEDKFKYFLSLDK